MRLPTHYPLCLPAKWGGGRGGGRKIGSQGGGHACYCAIMKNMLTQRENSACIAEKKIIQRMIYIIKKRKKYAKNDICMISLHLISLLAFILVFSSLSLSLSLYLSLYMPCLIFVFQLLFF